MPVPRTESARAAFQSFLRLRDALEGAIADYLEDQTPDAYERVELVRQALLSLLDLSAYPRADRRQVGDATVLALLDVFGRVPAPDPAALPGVAETERDGPAAVRLGDTPIRIVRVEAGERIDEHLFGPRTPVAAERFLRVIERAPLRSRLDIRRWSTFAAQITGPAIPLGFVLALPDDLRRLVWGTPIWKTLAMAALTVAAVIGLRLLHRATTRRRGLGPMRTLILRLATPLALLALVSQAAPWALLQIVPSGEVARIALGGLFVLWHVALAWLFWILSRLAAERLIQSPDIAETSLDANLIRLVAGIVGVVGVAVIAAVGGQVVGLPVASVLAGLGIGGAAVALAARPTLENLIGGITLYIDKPVRVGDLCSFGDSRGTVEDIGIRTTQLRAPDRTLVSIPNAQFADMKLVNWSRCDRMMISIDVGLRFETTGERLRAYIDAVRMFLRAHPRLDATSASVRYAGPGESSRNIELRVLALTRDWTDYFEIRQEVFLELDAIAAACGVDHAFPSRTVYLAGDPAPDPATEGFSGGRDAPAEGRTVRGAAREPRP